ncbi:MAG: tail protein X [Paenirhodobacter sp.]|uniref:tail protein X n=1 Tax=Paenirhodobacter sp. TaxID=1965326 RepID=UPI003D0E1E86
MKYRTKDGDVLDAICLAHYGSNAHVPAVLEANRGLAALGAVMPSGIVIELPAVEDATDVVATVRLWD